MPATWPAILQQELNRDGFTFSVGSTTLRTENQMGPVKTRRMMTKSVDTIRCSIDIPVSEFDTMYNFYDVDCNGGAGTFTFNHPMTGTPTTFRFVTEPSFSPLGSTYLRVSMVWETIPS